MKCLTPDQLRAYLRSNGVSSPDAVQKIILGFDFNKPVYEQPLDHDGVLFQFIRNPSANESTPAAGNWFCLSGATTGSLAIIDGGAGRRLHKYRVVLSLTAIEGSASRQNINWIWSGGGPGGGTQIYIPPPLIGRLRAVAPHERW